MQRYRRLVFIGGFELSSPRAAILDPQQVFAEVGTVGGELDGHLKFAQG